MAVTQDLVGQKFGMLTVISRAESDESGKRRWLCRCDCGAEKTVLGSNLKRGTTVSCGCKRQKDLTGQKIGKLTVLERSDQYATRGQRKRQLWKCLCDCGEVTYKATDTLTNPDRSMCKACAASYAAGKARENAGYREGTQLSRIRDISPDSQNLSGVRGVYLNTKTGKYRVRIKFKGVTYNLGTFSSLEAAIKERARAEEEIFGKYLDTCQENEAENGNNQHDFS